MLPDTFLASGIFSSEVLIDAKPDDAVGVMARLDIGPVGFEHDFLGFDMVLFANLSGEALDGPMLGVGSVLTGLVLGGWQRDPLFGRQRG